MRQLAAAVRSGMGVVLSMSGVLLVTAASVGAQEEAAGSSEWTLEIGGDGPFAGVHRGIEAFGRGGTALFEGMPDILRQRAEELGYGVRSFEFRVPADADLQMTVAMQFQTDGSGPGIVAPGTYEIGPSDVQAVFESDRLMRGEFAEEPNAQFHRDYQNGDGTTDDVGTKPPPVRMIVTELTHSSIVGRVEGELWTYDAETPAYVSVPMSLEFRAQRCLSGGRGCRPLPEGVGGSPE